MHQNKPRRRNLEVGEFFLSELFQDRQESEDLPPLPDKDDGDRVCLPQLPEAIVRKPPSQFKDATLSEAHTRKPSTHTAPLDMSSATLGLNSKQSRAVSPQHEHKTGLSQSLVKGTPEESPLHSLSDFLDAMFQSRRPSRKLSLSTPETVILKSIIRRKYGNVGELLAQTDSNHLELYSRLQETSSNKRPEENYKFIFKRCLKHMKEKFKTDNPSQAKRKDVDRLFYEHYFRQVSETQKISIDNFYHPKNSKVKSKTGPKTINNTYIQNICKSKLFKKDFADYLDKRLLPEYQESIKLKIKNLIARWSKELKGSSDKTAASTDICGYVERNKKCKLPWSVKEVSEAIRAVNALFEHAVTKTS